MAWDANRPVPWRRLLIPFALYAAVMAVIFGLFGGTSLAGLLAGVAIGGAFYLAIAVLLVKFGWNPPQFGGKRATSSTSSPASAATTAKAPAGPRAKPSPTRRTNAGNRQARRR